MLVDAAAKPLSAVVATRNPPLTSPPQLGTLRSLWSVVIPAAGSHGKAGTPLAADATSSGWLFSELAVSTRFKCPMALGRPCHMPLLLSICSRNRNRCECTRTLQHVAMSGDTVENPSLQRGLVVCWRLRQRRSSSSCWHRPAFVHHIWPRWKLNRAQVSFPTYPSTMPDPLSPCRPWL